MKKNIFNYILILVILMFWKTSFASETTWTINTGLSNSTINLTITCPITTVLNWSVNSQTCVISCNSWYNLSWNSCVLNQSSWGSWGGWWWSLPSVCSDSQLECLPYLWWTVWIRKTWVNCEWWNLSKVCSISTNSWALSSSWILNNTWASNSSWSLNYNNTWSVYNTWPVKPFNFTWSTNDYIYEYIVNKWNNSNSIIFLDIWKSFAKTYIEDLYSKWIIKGYDNKTFKPEDNATRIELLKIILSMSWKDYSKTDVSKLLFSDIDKNSWQTKVVVKGSELGYIDTKVKKFRPNEFITRAEAIKMIIKSTWITLSESKKTSFLDVSEDWMKKYINKSLELWIISSNNKFRPMEFVTRAEVAKMVIKAFEKK
jgi:hypothetical protein